MKRLIAIKVLFYILIFMLFLEGALSGPIGTTLLVLNIILFFGLIAFVIREKKNLGVGFDEMKADGPVIKTRSSYKISICAIWVILVGIVCGFILNLFGISVLSEDLFVRLGIVIFSCVGLVEVERLLEVVKMRTQANQEQPMGSDV